jgi:hypothetical protein
MVPASHDTPTTLTIEARHLDTDARQRTTLEAVAPEDASRQRQALVDAVTSRFPAAKLRSFADGAASFLDRDHLIVASYADLPRRRRDGGVPASQEALFAG